MKPVSRTSTEDKSQELAEPIAWWDLSESRPQSPSTLEAQETICNVWGQSSHAWSKWALHKCFSQDTEACPDLRSPPLCTLEWGHALRHTTPHSSPHVTRTLFSHFSLQRCLNGLPSEVTPAHAQNRVCGLSMTLGGAEGHDHFSSRKWNSCRSFYLLYCSVLWSLLILNMVIVFPWGSLDLLRTDPHYKLGRKLTEQLFLMENFHWAENCTLTSTAAQTI